MRGDYIDLEPPRAQVKAGRLALTDEMELIPVEEDIFHVAERLKRIDPGLHLSFHKTEGVFVLQWKGLNEKAELVEEFVGAYKELDGRLIHLVERLAARENRNRYELAKELDRLDAQVDRDAEHDFYEKQGPIAEELAYAIRKDLGTKSRAFLHTPHKKKRKR